MNENQIKEELKTKLSTISSVFIIAQDAYLYTEYFHNQMLIQDQALFI